MEKQAATLMLLNPRDDVLRAFRKAFRDGAAVRTAATPEEAAERIRCEPYGSAIVINGEEKDAELRVRSIKIRLPDIPVIAVVHSSEASGRTVWRLYHAGCDELLTFPDDRSPEVLRHRLSHAVPDDILDIFESSGAAVLPGRTRRLLREASRIGMTSGFPRDLAARLHASPSTVLRWFERAGLPSPRKTLLFVRILVAARLLENPDRTIEEVARATGYSTPQALRKAIREVTGLSPSALRREQAFEKTADAVRNHAP